MSKQRLAMMIIASAFGFLAANMAYADPISSANNYSNNYSGDVNTRTGRYSGELTFGSLSANGKGENFSLSAVYSQAALDPKTPFYLSTHWAFDLPYYNISTQTMHNLQGKTLYVVGLSENGECKFKYYNLEDIKCYGKRVNGRIYITSIVSKDGSREHFNANGYLSEISYPQGYTVNLTFQHGLAKLSMITDSFGNSLKVSKSNREVISELTPTQSIVAKATVVSGKLISFTYNPGSDDSDTTQFTYQSGDNLLKRIKYSTGASENFTYGTIKTKSTTGVSTLPVVTKVEFDPQTEGEQPAYIRYAYGGPIGSSTFTGHNYTGYPSYSNVTKVTAPDSMFNSSRDYSYSTTEQNTLPSGGVYDVTTTYNNLQLPVVTKTEAGTDEHRFERKSELSYCRTVDGQYIYGTDQNCISKIEPGYNYPKADKNIVYDVFSSDSVFRPHADSVEQMWYDKHGNLDKSISANGIVTSFKYDATPLSGIPNLATSETTTTANASIEVDNTLKNFTNKSGEADSEFRAVVNTVKKYMPTGAQSPMPLTNESFQYSTTPQGTESDGYVLEKRQSLPDTVASQGARSSASYTTVLDKSKDQHKIYTAETLKDKQQSTTSVTISDSASGLILEEISGPTEYLLTNGKIDLAKIDPSNDPSWYNHVNESRIEYDRLARPVKEITDYKATDTVGASISQSSDIAYSTDAADGLSTEVIVHQNGYETKTTMDSSGHVIKEEDNAHDTGLTQHSRLIDHVLEKNSYNRLGQLTQSTVHGVTTDFHYNALGEEIQADTHNVQSKSVSNSLHEVSLLDPYDSALDADGHHYELMLSYNTAVSQAKETGPLSAMTVSVVDLKSEKEVASYVIPPFKNETKGARPTDSELVKWANENLDSRCSLQANGQCTGGYFTKTEMKYDAFGRPIETIGPKVDEKIDGKDQVLQRATETRYDVLHHFISQSVGKIDVTAQTPVWLKTSYLHTDPLLGEESCLSISNKSSPGDMCQSLQVNR